MTTKHGLITDSFKVVKKARRGSKREQRPPTPPSPVQQQNGTEAIVEAELEKLRQFDLDWRFGPCTGITRLQRWERAQLHGLNPPEDVRELLLQAHTQDKRGLNLWSDYPL